MQFSCPHCGNECGDEAFVCQLGSTICLECPDCFEPFSFQPRCRKMHHEQETPNYEPEAQEPPFDQVA